MRILQGTSTVPGPDGAPETGIPIPCLFQPPLSIQLPQGWASLEPAQLREGGLAPGMEWGEGTEEGRCMPVNWQGAWADASSLILTLAIPRALQNPEREISTLTGSATDIGELGPRGH